MSRMRPPLTTSMTGPRTTPSCSLMRSMSPQARSYCARFLERTSRPSLSSFWRTRASIWSPTVTISLGSTSLRMESSREGMTPSDLNPMSSRTSSLSTFTTVPWTMSPSSNSTMVPEMASSKDMPPRSSLVTWRGVYSPVASSKVPNAVLVSDIGEDSLSVAVVFRTGNGTSVRSDGHHEVLVRIDRRRGAAVLPRPHRPQMAQLEAGVVHHQPQLTGRETGGPEVELGILAVGVLHGGALVVDATLRVERA